MIILHECNVVVPVTGNTRGAHKSKRHVSWSVIDKTPLSKWMKQ